MANCASQTRPCASPPHAAVCVPAIEMCRCKSVAAVGMYRCKDVTAVVMRSCAALGGGRVCILLDIYYGL